MISDTVGPSCSPTVPPRLKSPSIRFLWSAVVKPNQAGEAYVNLATTTALNIIWRLSVDSPWLRSILSACIIGMFWMSKWSSALNQWNTAVNAWLSKIKVNLYRYRRQPCWNYIPFIGLCILRGKMLSIKCEKFRHHVTAIFQLLQTTPQPK